MTLLLALLAQESPADVIRTVTEAIGKKDLELMNKVMEKPISEEEWKKGLEKLEKDRALESLRKAPALGAVGDAVVELRIRWKYPVEGGLMSMRVELRKVDGKWKFDDMDPDFEAEQTSKGTPGATRATPAERFAKFAEAIEKKEYGSVAELFPETDRKELTAERVAKEVEKSEAKFGGKWLATLKLCGIAGATDDALTEVTVGVRTETHAGAVDWIKENGSWQIRDLDVDPVKK